MNEYGFIFVWEAGMEQYNYNGTGWRYVASEDGRSGDGSGWVDGIRV